MRTFLFSSTTHIDIHNGIQALIAISTSTINRSQNPHKYSILYICPGRPLWDGKVLIHSYSSCKKSHWDKDMSLNIKNVHSNYSFQRSHVTYRSFGKLLDKHNISESGEKTSILYRTLIGTSQDMGLILVKIWASFWGYFYKILNRRMPGILELEVRKCSVFTFK